MIYKPKWFKTTHHLKQGDIVLFTKQESTLKAKYQYGIFDSVAIGKYGNIRRAVIKYKNFNESVYRYTNPAVRELVVIRGVDELDIVQQLGEIKIIAQNDSKNLHNVS